MKNLIKKIPFIYKLIKKYRFNKAFSKKVKKEYNSFINDYMFSDSNRCKEGYIIILNEHALEKGMTNKEPRCFGVKKVETIIGCLEKYKNNRWEKDYAYNLGISILHSYIDFYKKYNWEDKYEYTIVKNFLDDKESQIKTGAFELNKKEFIDDSKIDYNRFLSSRHSFREFENRDVLDEDVERAIEMAIKTPSACNRQMCKVYYAKNSKTKILKYLNGLTGFNNDTINMFVITYDISSLTNINEFNQGMFNAGLFSMNFVNAFHSLGIGSCFLEYANDLDEENKMKAILDIPKNEKIAIVIAAGYYPEKSSIPYSTRKPLNEVYRKR